MKLMENLKNNIVEVNFVRSFQWIWRHSTEQFLTMPIKVKSYFHQQMTFNFVCNKVGKTNRVLIVCLLSTVDVWQQEDQQFAAFSYELTILKGSSAKKKKRANMKK